MKIVIVIAMLAAVLVAAVTTYTFLRDEGVEVDVRGEVEGSLLDQVNAYRAAHGVAPLKANQELTNAAQWMANDMAVNDYFGHTDSLGRSPFQRMVDFGYDHNTLRGENLAAGVSDPALVLLQWQGSLGHNALLLEPGFAVVGIGRAFNSDSNFGWYWSMKFGGHDPMTQYIPTPAPTAVPNPVKGDMDCDGVVSVGDAVKLVRFILGLPVQLLEGCPAIGQ